jgi:hypothetical protein
MLHVKKINLQEPVNIDNITVRKDHYFPNAYIIDIPLDSEPDHVWQDIFEREWRTSKHLWDRKIFIIGATLRLVTTPEEMEEKIGWIKQVVLSTNRNIEDYNKGVDLTLQSKPETQRVMIEHDEIIETIRKALRSALRTV